MSDKDKKLSSSEKLQFWQRHFHQWKNSSLNQTQYCKEHGLTHRRFSYWKTKVESSQTSFIPVSIVSEVQKDYESTVLNLTVGQRYQIEVREDFRSETLERLLRTLERA